MTTVALGFLAEPRMVPLDKLLPSRQAPERLELSRKFKQIRASIEEIGLIEPLSVTVIDEKSGEHLLLDGHIRLIALRELGHEAVPCLIATDDEAFTYNNRVNRLSTVQEHLMLRRAVERGVSPERLGRALGVNASAITRKATLLDGICPEAVELLKDRRFSVDLGRVLRKMKPSRQVECIELMISANNFSVVYAKGLLMGTPIDGLVGGIKSKGPSGVTPVQMARMEREMERLRDQYRLSEQSYGQDILELTVALGYLGKLLKNERVIRFVQKLQPEVYEQMATIVATTSLEG